MRPEEASRFVADLIGLPKEATEVLAQELDMIDEDPILAVRLNSVWVDIHGQAEADAVLDAIGTFRKQAPERRESIAGYRWLFHFNDTSEIWTCRDHIAQNALVAFGLSPLAVTAGAVGVAAIPMAFCAMISKLAIREDDVMPIPFFYL
jgi:hypothetical protein